MITRAAWTRIGKPTIYCTGITISDFPIAFETRQLHCSKSDTRRETSAHGNLETQWEVYQSAYISHTPSLRMTMVSLYTRQRLFMTTNNLIVSFPATDASEIDEMSEYSELTELSDLSDSERVPYTLNVPQNGYHNGTTSQRRKRKKRSPYSLIVRLRYHGCDRTNRNEIPVSFVPSTVKCTVC